MTYQFLTEEWMTAAKAIREKYADQVPAVTVSIRMNQVITDVPFGDGTVKSYLDTSSGAVEMELGELEAADLTVTTDYDTARKVFVDQDQAAGMQAFMSGKIKVQGDMMKMMAMQTGMPQTDITKQVSEEIKAITA
jgi:putative sterol carrier protein